MITNFTETFHLFSQWDDVVTSVGTRPAAPVAHPTHRGIPVGPLVVGTTLGLGVAYPLPGPGTYRTPGPTGEGSPAAPVQAVPGHAVRFHM
jgi:hypothetical protein